MLKKEFKAKDVQRLRNLITKKQGDSTVSTVGYENTVRDREEGDVWEEAGKLWTLKRGIKQTVTKLDAAKKAMEVPLKCPKCQQSLNHHLHQKMYRIHGVCFDCTVDYEAILRRNGLYKQYEAAMMAGSLKVFERDLEQYLGAQESKTAFVTDLGELETWQDVDSKGKEQQIQQLQELLDHVKVRRKDLEM